MITNGMRSLMVDYVAHVAGVGALDDVNWGPLAQRLKVDVEMIHGAVQSLNEKDKSKLWADAIDKRVKHVAASDVFTKEGWSQVEYKSVEMLTKLLQSGLIRDPAELLSIAKVSNQMNRVPNHAAGEQSGTRVNVNIGLSEFNSGGGVEGEDEMDHVPGRVNAVRIDLSPRTAEALQRRKEQQSERVIDANRVNVEELRVLGDEFSTDSKGDS